MFLEKIEECKRAEIAKLRERFGKEDWDRARRMPPGRSLQAALSKQTGISLIAEVKPASPSKGVIRSEVNPVQVAKGYENGGAAAVSVLTDVSFFYGNPESLRAVKEAVQIPVLRKDFILDPLQVLESKLLGADAILLIVALLEEDRLQELSSIAHRLEMEVLVEVHAEKEIPAATRCGADVIGINNRNLHTFVTDLATTERLRPLISASVPVIGESGVFSIGDAKRMLAAGVDGLLIGEYLMRQTDPGAAVKELIEGTRYE
ncbi:indole-3-glycerol phosphate synthase TrpC [Thermoactinomyces daqus]|uniref:Indole-3-glycerol phosphate synthase n=1 Tax=Thermoactinomyces daqus TaxID=1329516 RepID=A0A7W1XAR0_9BACL|nr:indole-3-glycerol phosphate synthase TrpC [Thermoactinomyces daqus]MBA4543146.1 indole-3-glycerol phosphate synthase TrpC [Thermoactinomyces daqus]